MRKALIVGIDHYDHIDSLTGCVNDAYSVKTVLERDADGTVNFATPRLLIGTGPSQIVSRQDLKAAVRELFEDEGAEIALFYFAGHGYVEDTGGFLCGSDCRSGDDGLPLSEVMTFVQNSPARNKIIVLDSCHSGVAGDSTLLTGLAQIPHGVTILTASTAHQSAYENDDGTAGVFTSLFVDALSGAAANLVGEITPGSVYAHIDQSLGPWTQRPVFKTNVQTFVSLRKSQPPIELADLQALTTHFPSPSHQLQLDPSFEPERPAASDAGTPMVPPDPINTATFATLQKYVKVNLVRPVDAPHMWHAAVESKSCELTVLGQHYWNLVAKDLI